MSESERASLFQARYPEKEAEKTWKHPADETVVCSIVRQKSGHLCGYARFPKRPVRESGYDGILRYVPVHGGITYANEDADDGSMVYGFDCSHAGDSPPLEYEKYPQYRDPDGHVWTEREVERETEGMVVSILQAVACEEPFLLAKTSEERAEVLDGWHDVLREFGIEFSLTDNFGAMIGVMFGGLKNA